MSFDASHIGFVLGSYAISAIVIAALIIMHITKARRHDRRLADLESEGAPRRKAHQPAER